ncbi:MAG: glycosyltransferase family protein [Phycisphaerae bacterium]
MRIAYGVHGYGRGHAMRAAAVLPDLSRRHEVLVLAGGDAFAALADDWPVVRIPTLRYHEKRPGKRSAYLTLKRNLPAALDLLLGGPGVAMVREALEDFRPDVLVSDSEAWTHRAARRLGVPRISFDHFGVLVYCRWPMGWMQRLVNRAEAVVYKALVARPDRSIVASFYAPPTRRDDVTVVGPVLRPVVRKVTPEAGDVLLVYFSHPRRYYRPKVEAALREAGVPVTVYGAPREGTDGNLTFRPLANRPFVEDLARCRAVFATAGNQLISEAMHFGTPILAMPEDSLEQRLNAAMVERLGAGMRTTLRRFSPEVLAAFLARTDEFRERIRADASAAGPSRDGTAEAVAAIERYAEELAGG